MSQNSFYGGKQGRTYNIVAHYDSVNQMVTLFEGGGNYNDVNYNEYVIIDTIVNDHKKYNRENGLLYRRGMAYSRPFNPNEVPLNNDFSLTDYDLRKDEVYVYCTLEDLGKQIADCLVPPNDGSATVCRAQTHLPRYRHFECVIVSDGAGGYIVDKLHQKKLYTSEEAREANDNATIARQSDPKDAFYNYKEQWSNFVLDPGGGAEYVGQIVGPKGDATKIEVVNWLKFEKTLGDETIKHAEAGEVFATRRSGIHEDDDSISYYDDIQFGYCNLIDDDGNIGQALVAFDMPFTNIKINAVSVSPYNPSIIEVQVLPSTKPVDIRDIYYLEPEDKYYIWDDTRVIDDPKSEGYPYKYLKEPGFVEMTPWSVEQIEGNTNPHYWRYNGLLREHQDSIGHTFYKDFEVYIPKGIHGTDFNGFDPLNVEQEYELFYNWIDYNDLDAGEEGTNHKASLGKLKVVKEITLPLDEQGQTDDSNLLIDYFNGDQDKVPIPTVQSIQWNKNSGKVIVTILSGRTPVFTELGPIEYVESVEKHNDKSLDGSKEFITYLNTLIDPADETSGHKQATISKPINELVHAQLYGDNLVVLYSDSTYRKGIYQNGNYVKLPYEGVMPPEPEYEEYDWTGTGDETDPQTGTILYYWENLGPILNGEHIFGKFSTPDELKEKYPNGFDSNEAGWVASVVIEDPEHPGQALFTELYAYDYYGIGIPGKYPDPADAWYQISSVAKNAVDPRAVIIVSEPDSTSASPVPAIGDSFLQQHGYWFELTDIKVATDNE